MGILDRVMQLKQQGLPDEQIIMSLQQQGITPKEISDALTQAQVKNAVNGINQPTQGMEQSIMDSQDGAQMQPQETAGGYSQYVPQTQEMQAPQYSDNYQQQEYYPQENYAPQTSNTDSMIEIAEQVFTQKVKKLKDEIEKNTEFRSLTEIKMTNMERRLKRMEDMMDKLQIEILEKVGSYGEDLRSIKKEMNMIEDSFSKVASPLMDKASHKKAHKK
jgi:hypothetical protein